MRIIIAFLAAGATVPALAQTGDIIVTGEKRPISLQKSATSVALYPQDDIVDQGLRNLPDIYDRTVNVASAFGGSGFSIRGITNIGVTNGGEASTATIFVDAVPMPSTFLQAAPLQLWDVARIEILRGPQSTLQGLNSLAGAIIVRTKDAPLARWQFGGRLILADEAQSRLSAVLGGPIDDDFGIRVAADRQGRDGTIWNQTRKAPEAQERSTVIRANMLWRPSGIPGLNVRMGFIHAERDGPFYTVYARTDVPDFLDRRIATDNVPNTTALRFDAATLDLRYQLTEGITLASEGSWSTAREKSQFDGDYGPANLAYANQQRHYRTVTEELRLEADIPHLSGVAGLYFFDRNLKSTTVSRTSVPTPIPTISTFLRQSGASGPVADTIANNYAALLPNISVDFSGSFPTHISTYAAFGDARIALTSSIALLLGVRAEREDNETRTIQGTAFAGTYPDPQMFGMLSPVVAQINTAVGGLIAQANGTLPLSRRRFESLLPKAGLAFTLSSKAQASFIFQQGYRSGGTSANIARGQAFAYDPETTSNYEVSLRSLLLKDRLRLNANAFYVDWKNQQVAVNFGLNAYDVHTVNAGRSHLYGFEADAKFVIRPQWTSYLSVGHVRTRFDQFTTHGTDGPNGLSGSEFAFAPRWTLSGGTDFTLADHWEASINATYASRSFGAPGINQAAYRIIPHSLVNMRLGYRTDTWSVHLTGTNILDKKFVAYKAPSESRAVLNSPRIVGIEISADY